MTGCPSCVTCRDTCLTVDAQCDRLSQPCDLCALYDRLDGRYRRFSHNNLRQLRRRLHRHTHIYTRVLPILRQISSLVYPKIQRKQVIMNVLHPGCARPPRWSTPVLWSRFEDGLASICVLIHSCKMPKESETTGLIDVRKWWLACNAIVMHVVSLIIQERRRSYVDSLQELGLHLWRRI